MKRPALFLDRDGVVNVDHGYVHRIEDFSFIDGIFELVRTANKANWPVIVITNQAGIGRGYYTEEDFHHLTRWMCDQFRLEGARIDDTFFCPYHPMHGIGAYRRDSDCRKPAPGMLLKAAEKHGLDLPRSILIGDKISDMQAGQNAGLTALFLFGKQPDISGFKRISGLLEVRSFIS